ncbi:adenylosuccinate synthetase, putative [Eimeria necatrix]|uniref:Adenylosuccinate synthetase n=1 Tax=Eimeria necatrix TaxID=51315 RepID=U6MK54_9EIME|nr:adenylosuccinate synthetase, putative [Eimeria necatrix]CDJ62849.1 adenylosuccinate synthetase, putative [Eimeria necatrix]
MSSSSAPPTMPSSSSDGSSSDSSSSSSSSSSSAVAAASCAAAAAAASPAAAAAGTFVGGSLPGLPPAAAKSAAAAAAAAGLLLQPRPPGWSLGLWGGQPQLLLLLGAQWGDEGKGKAVDYFAAAADVCCRFNGGHNAGHQLQRSSCCFSFHLLPAAALSSKAKIFIGNGVVVSLRQLVKELLQLHALQLQQQLQQQQQQQQQEGREQQQQEGREGEQQEDVAAAAAAAAELAAKFAAAQTAEEAAAAAAAAWELGSWDRFEEKYLAVAAALQQQCGAPLGVGCAAELEEHRVYRHLLAPQLTDTAPLLLGAVLCGARLLLEGANAALLDLDLGTYPFVTSCCTTAAAAAAGLGLPLRCFAPHFAAVVGVAKAYSTRVGRGPFPTELRDRVGDRLQRVGRELGSTTGRSRRCGWLDLPLLLHAARLNGFDCLFLNKLDVLSGIDPLLLCVAYRDSSSGLLLPPHTFPAAAQQLQQVLPVYEHLPGWQQNISRCRSFHQLPPNAQLYVHRVQQLLGIPVAFIGVGPDTDDVIRNF